MTFITEQASSAQNSEIQRGIRAVTPILFGLVPVALAFGALASQKGLTASEVSLMTGLNFAGGSEFAAIGLWQAVPPLLLIVAITFLVNSRHLLMGAALTPHLAGLPRWKAYAVLVLMCDESWALGLADARKHRFFSLPFYFGQAVTLYLGWMALSTLGALAGPLLGDIEQYGADLAFPAVFLVLLRGMWPGVVKASPWLASLAVAIAAYLALPGAWYVPLGALTGLGLSWLMAGRT
ncbi:AzlC family ABC transporter permease [Paracoccus litorisediminis]|uniref:Branched-chain amino acid ABC transporter permease n=1 Tax=Paracoccus litorisediminis TaxID=2006130 RepID=A0A844HTP4_9RHOB|nr:AzlC family ABC transporter permease [Paracoccus litorisediminis]MTH61595.1 branched-chain amino acid ABC transporter permease [Paracoccus litorisediminis]